MVEKNWSNKVSMIGKFDALNNSLAERPKNIILNEVCNA
ncbi:hypothetical protein DSBG_1572 [Desulfosporosinus sp. BG]|nr:hypothetical protein DSBG_1572 [Desulfosporosinus sp. BG]